MYGSGTHTICVCIGFTTLTSKLQNKGNSGHPVRETDLKIQRYASVSLGSRNNNIVSTSVSDPGSESKNDPQNRKVNKFFISKCWMFSFEG
jgi:hypothetical protein